MKSIVVVQHKKTRKMLPFEFKGQNDEIEIISSGVYNIDDYIVSVVDSNLIDWDNLYVMDRSV